jgi:hypothetical protein
MTEVIRLKIDNLIATKRFITAQAEHDNIVYEVWRFDYSSWIDTTNSEIDELFSKLESENGRN